MSEANEGSEDFVFRCREPNMSLSDRERAGTFEVFAFATVATFCGEQAGDFEAVSFAPTPQR